MEKEVRIVFDIAKKVLGLEKEEILSKSRKTHIVDAKRIVSVILDRHTKLGPYRIGKMFGIDHSSVCHYKRTHQGLIETDYKFRKNFVNMEVQFMVNKENLKIRLKMKLEERDRLNQEISTIRKRIRVKEKIDKRKKASA